MNHGIGIFLRRSEYVEIKPSSVMDDVHGEVISCSDGAAVKLFDVLCQTVRNCVCSSSDPYDVLPALSLLLGYSLPFDAVMTANTCFAISFNSFSFPFGFAPSRSQCADSAFFPHCDS